MDLFVSYKVSRRSGYLVRLQLVRRSGQMCFSDLCILSLLPVSHTSLDPMCVIVVDGGRSSGMLYRAKALSSGVTIPKWQGQILQIIQ